MQGEWRRQWHPASVLLPGKSHGRRSLVGCSPWGHEESATTERLHFHFSLSCIGEGNGNPLQRSCLESPRDGGAWWAAVCGVAQSRTRLKRLSSSSSRPRLQSNSCAAKPVSISPDWQLPDFFCGVCPLALFWPSFSNMWWFDTNIKMVFNGSRKWQMYGK